MDPNGVDRSVRHIAASASRRWVPRALSTLPLLGSVAALLPEESAACSRCALQAAT